MVIGILKEQAPERRVAMLPEGVLLLKKMKLDVLVEDEAGKACTVDNTLYEEAGATVCSKQDVMQKSDVLLKVNSYTDDEISKLKPGQIIFGVLNPILDSQIIDKLNEKQATAFSLELVPRITRAQAMDVLSSQATVAGYKAVLTAANSLPKFFPMFMSAAGTIKPAKILVLGAGVAGLQAIAVARKLGAVVEVFDVRSAVKEEVQSLGGKFVEVEGATEDSAAGGYAVEQSEEFKQKQAQLIHDHAVKANVVICTAQIPGRKAPVLIKKETVYQMLPGAVIIDLAASTGGNCELTENDKTVEINQVSIIGNSNFPSEMPFDSSSMFGKNIINFMKLIVEEGNLNLNFDDEIVAGTCLVHDKNLVNERIKNILNK
jgi:NAD(P) transhydrogenase subunit alpha